jgi:hypothetical protein
MKKSSFYTANGHKFGRAMSEKVAQDSILVLGRFAIERLKTRIESWATSLFTKVKVYLSCAKVKQKAMNAELRKRQTPFQTSI